MATPNLQPERPAVQVRTLNALALAPWNQYVRQHPKGGFFQLADWSQAVDAAFGYRSHSLVARRGNEVSGVLPLSLVSNWIGGKYLLSVPFGVYGGILANDAETEQALLAEAKGLAERLGVDHLELRSRKCEPFGGFHRIDRYATFGTILSDPESNLKRLPRDTRYMIRKGEKAGLTTRHGLEQMDAFFLLFAQNMHHHGTPMFPRRYFELLVEKFASEMDLMLVYHGEKAIAGVLSFLFRDAVLPYYAGVTPEARAVAGNNFMYWELMKWAMEHGIRWFDFGRSKKGTGAYEFKTTWNMEVEELDYQLLLVRGTTVPNLSPTNPKFERATRVWQKLPLWATLKLGPTVSRWFP